MSRSLALLLTCLVISCQGGKNYAEFVGEYQLLTRDGLPLPASHPTVLNGESCLNDMLSGTLTIRSNGTWTESLTFRHRCGPKGTEVRAPITHVENGTFVTHDELDRIVLTSQYFETYGAKQEAVFTGDELWVTYSAKFRASEDTNPASVMRYTFHRIK